MKIAYAAISLIFCSSAAVSGILDQSDFSFTQPQISRDAGGFSSCGFRSVVNAKQGKKLASYDFSLTIHKSGLALGKAGKYMFSERDIGTDKRPVAETPEPTGFWVSSASSGKAARISDLKKSPDSGFILGITDFDIAIDTIISVLKNERMQVAVTYKTDHVEHSYGYLPNLNSVDRDSLAACMRGLLQESK